MSREQVTLRVRDQGGGPVIRCRWRDTDGVQVEKVVGRGWLVRDGEKGGKPKGKMIGAWRERRGNPENGALTPDAARERVQEIVSAHAAQVAKEKRRAARQGQDDRHRTISEAVEDWIAWRSVDDPDGAHTAWKFTTKKNTSNYARRLARELGPDRPVESVTADELRKLLAEGLQPMRNGTAIEGREVSRKMRSYYAATLRGVFARAHARGWTGEDPASELPAYRARKKRADDPLRRHEYLAPDELRSIVAELRKGADGEARRDPRGADAARAQDAAIVTTMAMAGLRPAEALALKWENVDLSGSSLRIVESRAMGVTDVPKSNAGRTVPLAEEVARELAAVGLREFGTAPGDLVFVGPQGGHVELAELRGRFNAAQDRAGISPRRELRQLRNTFGTVCAAAGVPLRTLQSWMGHESITTTEVYASFMPREQDAALVSAAFSAGTADAAKMAEEAPAS